VCGWIVSLLLLLVFSAARADAATTGAEQSPKANAGLSRSITIATDQGLQLHGLYVAGKEKGPGVVLLHMDGRSSEDWKLFTEKLGKHGIHALAIDLRGHGKSTRSANGKALTYDQLDEAQYLGMIRDVGAAVTYLRTRTNANPAQISLIGASIGANLAIRYAAEDARISNVLLLSPGLEYKGVAADDAVKQYGNRPLFIAVSREDNFSSRSSLILDSMAKGKKFLQIYTGAGHGTKMLSREPGLESIMISWLNGTLDPNRDAEELVVPKPGVPGSSRATTRPN